MASSDYDLELEQLFEDSIGRLLQVEVFDESAFQAFQAHLCARLEELRSTHVVSKQLLSRVLKTVQVLRELGAQVTDEELASKWERSFDLMLYAMAHGEGCDDRVPGTPRMI